MQKNPRRPVIYNISHKNSIEQKYGFGLSTSILNQGNQVDINLRKIYKIHLF